MTQALFPKVLRVCLNWQSCHSEHSAIISLHFYSGDVKDKIFKLLCHLFGLSSSRAVQETYISSGFSSTPSPLFSVWALGENWYTHSEVISKLTLEPTMWTNLQELYGAAQIVLRSSNVWEFSSIRVLRLVFDHHWEDGLSKFDSQHPSVEELTCTYAYASGAFYLPDKLLAAFPNVRRFRKFGSYIQIDPSERVVPPHTESALRRCSMLEDILCGVGHIDLDMIPGAIQSLDMPKLRRIVFVQQNHKDTKVYSKQSLTQGVSLPKTVNYAGVLKQPEDPFQLCHLVWSEFDQRFELARGVEVEN